MKKNDKSLKVRVIKQANIEWQKLQFVQSDQFKELTPQEKEKLKKSIVNNKFVDPFKVWQDRESGIIYCLDGKHRTIILEEIQSEGIEVPKMLPAVFIECQDINEAAKLVLTYSSTYARITEHGLAEFVETYNIPLPEIMDEMTFPAVKTLLPLDDITPTAMDVDMFFINIQCNDENHCQQLYERLSAEGLDVKIVR